MLMKIFSSATQVIASLGPEKNLSVKVQLFQEPFYNQKNEILCLYFPFHHLS